MCVLTAQLCPTVCNPMDRMACQAPLSMEFSRQEYWSGQPFPSPGDLPNPGIEPRSPASRAGSLPSEPPGKPQVCLHTRVNAFKVDHARRLFCIHQSSWLYASQVIKT